MKFKLDCLTYEALSCTPAYLRSLLVVCDHQVLGLLMEPWCRTVIHGSRAFQVSGPKQWNQLSRSLSLFVAHRRMWRMCHCASVRVHVCVNLCLCYFVYMCVFVCVCVFVSVGGLSMMLSLVLMWLSTHLLFSFSWICLEAEKSCMPGGVRVRVCVCARACRLFSHKGKWLSSSVHRPSWPPVCPC